MAIQKTEKGFSVTRKVGKDNKGCPRINLIKDMGIVVGSSYIVTQSDDAKTIMLEQVEEK